MSLSSRDCSLDLHEAMQLLELLFNVFENAEDAQDWWTLRQPVGSGIYAVQRIIREAMTTVEGQPKAPGARAH